MDTLLLVAVMDFRSLIFQILRNPDSVKTVDDPRWLYALVLMAPRPIFLLIMVYIYMIFQIRKIHLSSDFMVPALIDGLEVKGDMAYRAAYDGRFEVFDVSHPNNITEFDRNFS